MDVFLIYLICFGVGLLFTLLSALFGEIFGGHEDAGLGTGGHAEAGFDHSGMPGISIFSPTVMAAFVTAFGGFGMIFSRFEPTKNPWISGPLSALCGIAIAGAVFVMFNRLFHRTQSSSEGKVAKLIGQSATISSPIPENGVGEIAYVQGGSRYSGPARSEKGVPIAAGATVKITRIVGTQFFVEAI